MSELPQPTVADSEHLSELTKSTDSFFKVLYHPIHGRAELIRTILAYSGAEWEELVLDWPNQKGMTLFKCVPVVYEVLNSGEVLLLAEQKAIKRYLTHKFGLFGTNAWVPIERRAEVYENFISKHWASFVEIHETHLAKNGSNGHYVGDKADFKLANVLHRLEEWAPRGTQQSPISATTAPGIWKVYETVNSHLNIATWCSSPSYEVLSEGTRKMFKI
ncbi:hypothetical protein K7432_004484 [Basidiobolus ranarum]|uniref:glutathione transferase n=1 Tax=Basidiobolus ranarum TaxID=34480 RepID=A0ABR2WY37_9FUNG